MSKEKKIPSYNNYGTDETSEIKLFLLSEKYFSLCSESTPLLSYQNSGPATASTLLTKGQEIFEESKHALISNLSGYTSIKK